MAAAASMQGTALGTMQGSCRPVTARGAAFPVFRFTLCWGRAMEGVGYTAARKVRGMPSVMPPKIPPQ